MKTAISVTDIERQLIHQLSSFFKVSNEEVCIAQQMDLGADLTDTDHVSLSQSIRAAGI